MNPLMASRQKAEDAWLRNWIAGPKRLRWTDLPAQVGDSAPAVTLRTEAAAEFDLRDAWKNGPAVLVFLRHFGCGCAWERAARLVADTPKLAVAGATIVAIGQGDPVRCRQFREKAGLGCPVLSDEGCRAYEAFGLLDARPSQVVYGMPEGFLRRDPKIAEDFLNSRRGTDRIPVDSPWQLPGEFVIGRDGVIKLAHRSQYCADYADPDVLVAAIREAVLGL